jgi:hypothetical protein
VYDLRKDREAASNKRREMKKKQKIKRLKRALRAISIWAELDDNNPIVTLQMIEYVANRVLEETEARNEIRK